MGLPTPLPAPRPGQKEMDWWKQAEWGGAGVLLSLWLHPPPSPSSRVFVKATLVFRRDLLLYSVCVCVHVRVHVWVCVHECMYPPRSEEGLGSPEAGVPSICKLLYMGAGNWTGSSKRAAFAFNLWAIYPAPKGTLLLNYEKRRKEYSRHGGFWFIPYMNSNYHRIDGKSQGTLGISEILRQPDQLDQFEQFGRSVNHMIPQITCFQLGEKSQAINSMIWGQTVAVGLSLELFLSALISRS